MAAGNYTKVPKGPIVQTRFSNAVVGSFAVGQKTVAAAGTAESLAASQVLTYGVTVSALPANTGNIYVGLSTVDATNGFVLDAGENVFIPIDDISKIFIDAEVSAEGVSYFGY